MKLLAEIEVRPENNAIIPPFTSKVGKTILKNYKLSISPLYDGEKFIFKESDVPTYIEVEGGKTYTFRVGGEEEEMIKALSQINDVNVFNTLWKIKDVKVSSVSLECKEYVKVDILTPAIFPDPFVKDEKKRFTNASFIVFAVNAMDEMKLRRGPELDKILYDIEKNVSEEPSDYHSINVVYSNKKVKGIVGRMNFRIRGYFPELRSILENAQAKGIGSSRHNGFGVVNIRC
ncbi:CRISPR-associated endoribonuclease Cas6 [Acidianus brierleyi]|uniref:Cas6 N-terminal domain-containing protein n=1 Tax=Acidianus brierleyi TaxID=41673 RepID=A0A2U9IHD3_9CREN|nr:CRISPR-associated endoribonuclease Cas6 [Acidianus brierleyi]AWR95452.1 CRISPR system precrRNA processing endoribonuclease RAMP protein Cas6 [Acidianus brierleyi]